MAVRITRAGVALTVGIIVVTGLIIGGLFWIRGAGEQARHDEATKIAEQQLEAESDNDVALNEGEEENANENESQSSGQNGVANNSSDQATSNQSNSSSSSSGSGTSELPATGAGDFAPALIFAILTFSVASFIASRRQLAQHL